jgi:hypothetical protein
MTQRTRDIIADVLFGMSILTVVVFVATHFMTPPRPSWRNNMVLFGIVCLIASRPVRGRPRWRATQN